MLLADEFFLIAHDDAKGRSRLHPSATGLGLAAGLLGELLLARQIVIDAGVVTVVDRRPPHDALAHTVLDQLVGEPEHRSVRTWLLFLGNSAAESVGERLARAGTVRREEARRLLRTTVVYRPADMNAAAWPATRLRAALGRAEPPPLADVLLLALLAATNLLREALWGIEPGVRQRLDQLVDGLPPPMRELARHTEAAVGAAVLSGRP
ncbi:GPP34 family phosphoprotein [Micromonospora sp. NPDC050397]|uniref:GOLPH3/VPS74 family protein n=1 Tax=Micromonospora sp. NPDC050397 TaxID=3364279 RepID=UPI00384BB194